MPFGPKRGWSDYIRPSQVRDILAAANHAETLGRPLNTCIDINWSRTSAGHDPKGASLQRVLKRLRRWLIQHGAALSALWVREHPHRKGPNGHIMLHLPRELLKELRQDELTLLPQGCRDLDGRSIRVHPTGETRAARTARVIYVCKGVKPGRIAKVLGIDPEFQGRIFGKRCGLTENLTVAARRVNRVKDGAKPAMADAA
jgi:hypothetical protein